MRATQWLRHVDRDILIAFCCGVATLVVLVASDGVGFVRDEGYYFRAARQYHGWFENLWRSILEGQPLTAFSDASLSLSFGYNREHPGFVKILMGWTWKVFHVWLGWTSPSLGFRLGPILLVALGNGFLYLFGKRMFGRTVGVLAVICLMLCPRVFYHAHLACFDGPIMALTVVVTYAFWRSLEARRWRWFLGLLFGIALATKHNAVFLILTFLLAVAGSRANQIRYGARGRVSLPEIPLGIVSMLLIGPVIFYLFYPYGWHAPIQRIGAYYGFHLHHEHYPVDYFGTLYTQPPFPWAYPFVMTAITVPLSILLAAAFGFGRLLKQLLGDFRSLPTTLGCARWLLLLSCVIPPLIIAFPTVPIFGGTKHWMTMMPFVALLCAWTIVAGLRWARARTQHFAWIRWAVVGLFLWFPACDTLRSHPYGHTYYNDLIGGYQGAAARRMPRTFWGGDGRDLLPQLNALAEPGARVFTDRMNLDDFRAYKAEGLVRSDLRYVRSVDQAHWALINHQREFVDHELEVWRLARTSRPVAVIEIDHVPLVSLYQISVSLE